MTLKKLFLEYSEEITFGNEKECVFIFRWGKKWLANKIIIHKLLHDWIFIYIQSCLSPETNVVK